MFLSQPLDHIMSLDPATLNLPRDGAWMFGQAPTQPLNRRKVWGERCSGTNFVGALLQRNFEALEKKGGQLEWKHGLARLTQSAPQRLNVVVVRDPFTWAQSFYRNPWHLPVRLRDCSFSEFIRMEWVGVFYDQGKYTPERPADRHPVERRRFRDIWELRAVKLRHGLVAADRLPNGVVATYEDISADPEAFVQAIGARFSLRPRGAFQSIADYKGEANRAYGEKSYGEISDEDRAFITSRLDARLEHFLGYVPNPADSGLRHELSQRANP